MLHNICNNPVEYKYVSADANSFMSVLHCAECRVEVKYENLVKGESNERSN